MVHRPPPPPTPLPGKKMPVRLCSVVWSPHTKRNINNLEQVQRRATRFILGRDYSEYERLSKLNLLPLKYRREINDLVFFFKCLKNICKLNILDYVSFRSCTKPLRDVDHLTLDVPFSRTDVFKNSFFVRICHLGNDLPLGIRESNTTTTTTTLLTLTLDRN